MIQVAQVGEGAARVQCGEVSSRGGAAAGWAGWAGGVFWQEGTEMVGASGSADLSGRGWVQVRRESCV